VMALHQSGYAADPAADQSSGRTAVGTAKTTGSASANRPAKKPGAIADAPVKNYYKDLFGEEGPASAPSPATKRSVPASAPAKTTAADWADEPQTAPPLTRGKSAAKTVSFQPDFDTSLSDLPIAAGKASVGPSDKSKTGPKVTQAVYDRPAGKKTSVQQIRNDGRPASAPPVMGVELSADSARPGSGKDSSTHGSIVFGHDETTTAPRSIRDASNQAGPATPQVTVEWVKRGEFNVGQECQVDLVVKNGGSTAVSQVAVDAIFPTNVRLTGAEPRPASATDRLTWTFEELPPASEHKITVKLIPSKRGDIEATANVRFTGSSSTAFAVQEPLLKISVKSPAKEVMLGDPASQMITVTNPGTGTAHDVKIEAKLSEGLEHPTREDHLVIDVGAVGPGETRTYRLGLTASKGGLQTVSVVATSSSDASSMDSVDFSVIAPSLKIAVEGPSLRYKGRNAKYTLTVTNDGSMVNNNIRISQVVADGFKFVSADHSGKFDASIKSIHWFVGRLEPGESTQVGCELHSLQIGEFAHTVQVVSDAGVQADARIETRVDGIASLTMELVDLDDPVETGSETAYEIRVKNDGSKVASGVILTCELPAGMELLSAKAPVDQVIEGRHMVFNAVDQIAPGTQVTFRVHLKVTQDGSHRMKARLSGGGLQEAMVLEEVTRAYSDGSN
jgi:uncharacterized repeat protein (TIGR01451 family)